jgi:transposase
VICLDEMGPEAAKSHPGARIIRLDPTGVRRERAIQEIDYGRRGKGYVFGAFRPATGEAFTTPYAGRTIANWVDFLSRVDDWLGSEAERVYAVLDNLSTHRAMDVLLWTLVHPRWEFVFQPTYAAYLNLIEPWWKVLRSLALKGRRFESWQEVCAAVAAATTYWNNHRHPFVWRTRTRRCTARRAGLAHPAFAQ